MSDQLALVDHHVHGAATESLDDLAIQSMLTEADAPAPPGTTTWDTQLGFLLRRWCAPVLDLEPRAPAAEYVARRAELGAAEVNRRFLTGSQVQEWLVDTGYQNDQVMTPSQLAMASGTPAREIVRLEGLAEQVIRAGGSAEGFAADYAAALDAAVSAAPGSPAAAGLKSIAAYRYGLDFDPAPPARAEVASAAGRWLAAIGADPGARLTDAAVLRAVIWAGVRTGLPLQFHVGLGDPDARLHRSDPGLMHDFLLATRDTGTAVMLLHCYPYQRQAGVLASVFPHVYLDVGEGMNHVGARSGAILAEAMEVAPFHKLLYSSDAWGLAELHYLGATGFRRDLAVIIDAFVADGAWARADGDRVAQLIGSGNALRVYGSA